MSYPRNAASPPPLFATVVKASDGTAITSAVAAKYSTGAGSQAAGGGTCQHEGNGQWSYTPTQAETNVIGFGVQFYHADAVGLGPTISVVTSADVAQSGDVYGIVSGGRIAADAQAISGDATAADNLETMLDGTGGQTLSLGAFNVVANSANPAVTISNAGTGNAIKLQSQSGDTLLIKQVSDTNNSAIKLESTGTGMWIYAENDNGIEITTDGINAVGLLINSYKQAFVLISEAGEAVHILTNVNNKPAIYVYHYGTNPGPAVKLESTISAGLEVKGTTPAPDVLLSGTGNLTAILSALAANAITAAALADDAGTEIAGAVRAELATELAHLDADVSTAGVGTQEVADALKLAPTAGEAATGSVYDLIGNIETGSGLTAQETANAVHNLAPAGTVAAGSVGAKLNNMPATILATAIAANDDTPGTVGYLLSLLAGLDFTQVNLVAASNAGEITIKRTLTLAAVVSGLTIPADWTACYWTVKRSVDDADADALAQVVVSNPPDAEDGLQVLAGAAVEDQTAGSLTVNQALGTVTIALDDASTAALEDAVELVWDVKVHAPGGKTQPGSGTATITTAVTRA